MKGEISPERLIEIVKFFTKLRADSPPSKRYLILRQAWWVIAGHAMVQCFQGNIRIPDDPIERTKTMIEVRPTLLSFLEMVIFKYHQGLLKIAQLAYEGFLKKSTLCEREVTEICTKSCTALFIRLGVSRLSAWLMIISDLLLLYAEGLFKVSEIQYALPHEDTKMITDLIYLSEAIATSAACFNTMIGIFLFYVQRLSCSIRE